MIEAAIKLANVIMARVFSHDAGWRSGWLDRI